MSDIHYLLMFCAVLSVVCAAIVTLVHPLEEISKWKGGCAILVVLFECMSVAIALVVIYIVYLVSTGG
jgi:hypothetical protein